MIVNVGIIGYGFMGRMHAKSLTKIQDAKLYAIADVSHEALKSAKKDYPWIKTYDNPVHLITDKNIDAIVIASYPNTHIEYLIKALENNKHVLVEKPLAIKFADVKPLLKIEYDTVVMVGFSLRYHDMYIKIKELIDSHDGAFIAHHTALGGLPDIPWLKNPDLSGGLLNENAVHIIYLFLWYMGDIDSVFSRIYSITGSGIDDNFVLVMTHTNNTTSSLVRSWTGGQIVRYYDFLTKEGSIHVDGYLEGRIRVHEKEKEYTIEYPRIFEEMYLNEMKHFIEAVKSGRKPYTSLEDGIKVQAVVEAARISSKEKRIVKLSEIYGY
ncbi:Gfo/Idh/MocA family oxidoreductase [Desulfurococcaceae archaeon MEX13E-LK6-19]|nr:Gfo/Idh/MocA family oxidoreductase [Desulfurococcaceae archaeon MEX13E-LK6-19]